MKSFKLYASAAIFGAIAFASRADANLIVNGGFETGSFFGWTLSGQDTFSRVNQTTGQTGNFAAYIGEFNGLGYISQTFATEIGKTYDVSFRFEGFNAPAQEFDVLFGAPTALPNSAGLMSYDGLTDLLTFGGPLNSEAFNLSQPHVFLTYSFSIAATSTTSQLTFATRQDSAYDFLDDVSVTLRTPGAPSAPSAVPEPSTYGLIGAAALLSVVAMRRLRTKFVVRQQF